MIEKHITEEINSLENLQQLVQTYEEIAASRMQRVKNSVLNNRTFLGDLTEIFASVKASYEREIEAIKHKAMNSENSIFTKQRKSVTVLLTSNTGLYGDIIRNTFEQFMQGIQGKDTDLVIVGKVGRRLFDIASPKTAYEYFDLSDGITKPEDFSDLIKYIIGYEKVVVYHGKFENILTQVPIEDILTGDNLISKDTSVETVHYIFEPSLSSIISFFESEIISAIFEQALFESNLSKFASRMINLDRAVVNIEGSLVKAQFGRKRVKHRNINKKQLNTLASLSLWN